MNSVDRMTYFMDVTDMFSFKAAANIVASSSPISLKINLNYDKSTNLQRRNTVTIRIALMGNLIWNLL